MSGIVGVSTTLELSEKLGSAAPQLAAIGYFFVGSGAVIKQDYLVVEVLVLREHPEVILTKTVRMQE